MGAVVLLVSYASTLLAVFVLRYREPAVPRPFKAGGYPFSTAVVLMVSLAILIAAAAAAEDPRSARFAVLRCLSAMLSVGALAEITRGSYVAAE